MGYDKLKSETSSIHVIPEAIRELKEEQGENIAVRDIQFLGLVKGTDQGYKPEVFSAVFLDATLSELQDMADAEEAEGRPKIAELARKLGRPMLMGDLVNNALSRDGDNELGMAIPARGGEDDVIALKDQALSPNCNQVLSAGILLLLERGYQ